MSFDKFSTVPGPRLKYQFHLSIMTLLLIVGDACRGADTPGKGTLEEYLKRLGYEPVMLERTDNNHLLARGTLNGKKRSFMVDTGWSFTTVSKRTAAKLKSLAAHGVKLHDSFLGTLSNPSTVLMENLTLGRAVFLNQPAIVELDALGYDGVLGADFLYRNYCLIDCRNRRLYARGAEPSADVRSAMRQTLLLSGFRDVPLRVKLSLVLTCDVKVNEETTRLLVDTGAIWSVLDLGKAQRLGLKLDPTLARLKGVGRRESDLVWLSKIKTLDFESVVLTNVNFGVAELKDWGVADPASMVDVQGILGAELLAKNNALIDCRGMRLWLQPPPKTK